MILDVNQKAVENALKGGGVSFDSAQEPYFDSAQEPYFDSAQEPYFDSAQEPYFDYAQEPTLLIHGHTHRPAEHEFLLDGRLAKRIVLGDWRDKACYLSFNKDGLESYY